MTSSSVLHDTYRTKVVVRRVNFDFVDRPMTPTLNLCTFFEGKDDLFVHPVKAYLFGV